MHFTTKDMLVYVKCSVQDVRKTFINQVPKILVKKSNKIYSLYRNFKTLYQDLNTRKRTIIMGKYNIYSEIELKLSH